MKSISKLLDRTAQEWIAQITFITCSYFSMAILIGRLLLLLVVANSEIHYYITPSQNISCPQDPCLTLSQFAASDLGNESNVLLSFLPGNHSLDRDIHMLQLRSIVMTKAEQNNESVVFLDCSRHGIIVNETAFTSITSLHFIECGCNTIVQVKQLIVQNTIFTNSMMSLNYVTSAKIENSLFSSEYMHINSNYYTTAAILVKTSSFTAIDCAFTDINAGGVIYASRSVANFINCTFANNAALDAVLSLLDGSTGTIINSTFKKNTAEQNFHTVSVNSSINIANCIFQYNTGSLYAFYSKITFTGYTEFKHCTEQLMAWSYGGAITSFQSSLIFNGVSRMLSNQASLGGALCAIGSLVTVLGQAIVANNTAIISAGGGFYLEQSDLKVFGNLRISHNHALYGGGLMVSSSPISVFQPGLLELSDNYAAIAGGGLYLDRNPRLNLLKVNDNASIVVIFYNNYAAYGGAVFVADSTSSGCSYGAECFMQSIALYCGESGLNNSITMHFDGNIASSSGSNLFGGLLDRCIPNILAEVYPEINYSGVSYLRSISDIALDSVSSLPVRICFCNSERQPSCSYQPPTIKVKKGEAFNVMLVAVDQVNHPVNAYINSYLAYAGGGFSEGQLSQKVTSNCTDLKYNIFSPKDSEILVLFPDGPCGYSPPSTGHLRIVFLNCTCPIGFEPSYSKPTSCECICDSRLLPYITDCNSTANLLVRVNTNSWITYVDETDPPGYLIYANCPFDYCHSPTEKVYFSLPDKVDAQCAYYRTGILCGACRENFSLSLGSSRCLPCNRYWPLVLVTTLIGSAIAGILLVAVLLILNITVAIGFISGIIFYANIIAPNISLFIPSSQPSFPSLLVSWLNLDIGFDLCFFNGLDMYSKTWLQLTLPMYIITLIIIVIKVSEHSPKFTRMLGPGRRDPIATLATLMLLSYSKLLSTTITILSYADLYYPDGSKVQVWLPDGNVQYLRGKHIVLAVAAFLIILVGVPYTLLLFFWQWLIHFPNSMLFRLTKSERLSSIIKAYHAPYSYKHRYWTGLLLLVRVVFYVISALFLSRNPQIPLLVINILIGGLFFLKSVIGIRLLKVTVIDIIETVTHLNILCFSVSSLYNFKTDVIKQTFVAYTSTITTLLMLVVGVTYHIVILIKRLKKTRIQAEEHAMVLPLSERQSAATEVTYSVTKRPTPEPPPTPPTISDTSSDTNSLEDQAIHLADTGEDIVPLLESTL